MLTYIRVDVAKNSLEVAALSGDREITRVKVGNDEDAHRALVTWLRQYGLCQVVCEATSSYHQHLIKHQTPSDVRRAGERR